MTLLHALSIRVEDLRLAIDSMPDDELEALYLDFIDVDNVRDGDDYRHPQVLVAQEWKKRTCERLPVLLP